MGIKKEEIMPTSEVASSSFLLIPHSSRSRPCQFVNYAITGQANLTSFILESLAYWSRPSLSPIHLGLALNIALFTQRLLLQECNTLHQFLHTKTFALNTHHCLSAQDPKRGGSAGLVAPRHTIMEDVIRYHLTSW